MPQLRVQASKTDFDAKSIKAGGKLQFVVDNYEISANYRGFYNIYNILAAYSAGRMAGLSLKNYNKVLKKYNPEMGGTRRSALEKQRLS